MSTLEENTASDPKGNADQQRNSRSNLRSRWGKPIHMQLNDAQSKPSGRFGEIEDLSQAKESLSGKLSHGNPSPENKPQQAQETKEETREREEPQASPSKRPSSRSRSRKRSPNQSRDASSGRSNRQSDTRFDQKPSTETWSPSSSAQKSKQNASAKSSGGLFSKLKKAVSSLITPSEKTDEPQQPSKRKEGDTRRSESQGNGQRKRRPRKRRPHNKQASPKRPE